MCSTILIGIRRIVIRTNVPSNISKNTLFSYKGIIAINKNDTTNKISITIVDIKKIFIYSIKQISIITSNYVYCLIIKNSII